MQRFFRGFVARKRYLDVIIPELVIGVRRRMILDLAATKIQAVFRGFISRAYIHDAAVRRQFVKSLVARGEIMSKVLAEAASAQQEELRQHKLQQDRAEFHGLASSMHHLVSTKNTPGVFNNPIMGPAKVKSELLGTDETAEASAEQTVANHEFVLVENAIKQINKSVYRKKFAECKCLVDFFQCV
jgi:hypothetical protein